jgi:hypothetical protein
VEFGKWLCQNVINAVPHRHFVLSIPLELSRCIWETLKIYYQSCLPKKNSIPGAVIALQTTAVSQATGNV